MIEIDFLNIIKKTLTRNQHIGDDCANLEDLGISVTQDNLAENIHFTLETISPYLLGYKSIAVNLSDLAASGCEPKYIFIGLSLPCDLGGEFVAEFYRGVNDICEKYRVEVAGGDITGSERLLISVCAIGKNISAYSSSRKNAKTGDYIITTGNHGSSACGFNLLQKGLKEPENIITAHLKPEPKIVQGMEIAVKSLSDSTIMDTSDGLADALYKIAKASGKTLVVDFDKIPFDPEIVKFASDFGKDYKDWILWGAEDYELVACVNKDVYESLNQQYYTVIGEVLNKQDGKKDSFGVIIKTQDGKINIDEEIFNQKSYSHFGNHLGGRAQ